MRENTLNAQFRKQNGSSLHELCSVDINEFWTNIQNARTAVNTLNSVQDNKIQPQQMHKVLLDNLSHAEITLAGVISMLHLMNLNPMDLLMNGGQTPDIIVSAFTYCIDELDLNPADYDESFDEDDE